MSNELAKVSASSIQATGNAVSLPSLVERAGAAGSPPCDEPSLPAAESSIDLDLLRLVETCEHRRIPECGCSGMDCVRDGRRVTLADCLACKGA